MGVSVTDECCSLFIRVFQCKTLLLMPDWPNSSLQIGVMPVMVVSSLLLITFICFEAVPSGRILVCFTFLICFKMVLTH